MKKTILLSALTAIGILTAGNEAKAQKGFYAGAQGTPGISSMYNADDKDDKTQETKTTFGISFGVGGGYNFNKNMGVGIEALYSLQGQRYEQAGLEYQKRLDYVKIPVFFSYNTNPAKTVMFTAKAGPQISILTNSELNVDTKGKDQTVDTKDQYESITFGAMVGAGVRVNVAKNLYVDGGLRFDGAFTNAEDKDAIGYPTGRANTYNLNAGVEVGVKYFFN
ncbi:MAG: PorT family protein [Flavipsychrobacter sp.]|nr:PorT family protein [Flavipsychrobacter sp.]